MQQMSLAFEPGLAQRYRRARECLATQVYQRGLVAVAGKLDMSPSKLTEKLAGASSDGKVRGFTLDELEDYIEQTGDVSVVHYLAEKYCRDPAVQQAEALAQLAAITKQLPALLSLAGLQQAPKGRRG
jgi:hypothetical protein